MAHGIFIKRREKKVIDINEKFRKKYYVAPVLKKDELSANFNEFYKKIADLRALEN